MQVTESEIFDELPKVRKRGRPKKDIDACVIFQMLKNNGTIAAVARHLGIHRDTIYTNFRPVIDEARKAWQKTVEERIDNTLARKREEKRLKEMYEEKKRAYRKGYSRRWRLR
jgi:hypothetical protein